MIEPSRSALLTDLYEITMLQAYFRSGMDQIASFELFVRKLPDRRNFLMAAGLEQVVHYLGELHFEEEELAWLRASGRFDPAFIESLKNFRFSGDVDAMPEGTVFFPDEPILRITAPLREAQFVESRVMNLIHYQTVVASKAARSVIAAQGRRLIDFGLRRAHGAEAALLSARASHIAGFEGTATAIAAPMFGIPVFGTMAHSYIQAHDRESDAFADFVRSFPDTATLLIDTYDTEAAAAKVARLAQRLRQSGVGCIKAVRIDSGELGSVAERVRDILDAGGASDIGIFASGNLDEYVLQSLVERGAPIDGFGVGTRMNTSNDAPYLDCAYKLVEYAGAARRKRSTGKATWPGRKQVYRRYDEHGLMCGDCLAIHADAASGEPLLQPAMRSGTVVKPLPSLQQIRHHARSELDRVPPYLRSLSQAVPYPVMVSEGLRALAQQVDEQQEGSAASESSS
ncbi:MAG TPA: nicotinate phosphoribosyltransferase [Noviherbaspirillum sp.]